MLFGARCRAHNVLISRTDCQWPALLWPVTVTGMDRWPALSKTERLAVACMTGLAEHRIGPNRDHTEMEEIAQHLETVVVERRSLVLAMCLSHYVGNDHHNEWAALPFVVMCGDEEIALAEEIAELRDAKKGFNLAAMADAS